MDDEKIYGIIVEWKDECPLIMEGYLASHDDAYRRMKDCMADTRVIRVAMFKAVYEAGNKTLLPKETL